MVENHYAMLGWARARDDFGMHERERDGAIDSGTNSRAHEGIAHTMRRLARGTEEKGGAVAEESERRAGAEG